MRRLAVMFLISLFFMGMFVPQPAGAFYESDTVNVEYDEYLWFSLNWEYDGTVYISVTNTYSDYNFDVFFIDSSQFSYYKSGESFDYYTSCSRRDTSSFTVTCNVNDGRYILIFDNTVHGIAQPYDDITFVYTVETTETGSGGDDYFLSTFMCMVLGIIGLIFIIVIVAVVVSKKRKRAVVLQHTAPPPAQPYPQYQPSQPPQGYGPPIHQTTPPPSTPPGYSPPPQPQRQPQQQQYQPTEAKDPPKLELPGMIGGTDDTLGDTYSGPPKPPKQ